MQFAIGNGIYVEQCLKGCLKHLEQRRAEIRKTGECKRFVLFMFVNIFVIFIIQDIQWRNSVIVSWFIVSIGNSTGRK